MTTNEMKDQQKRVLPIPLRPAEGPPAQQQAEAPMDRVWRQIGETLEVQKAGVALKAVGLTEQRHEVASPWQGTLDFAKGIGLDVGEMNRQRSEELQQLRTTLAEKDREVHEMRIRQLDETLAKLIEAAKKFQDDQGAARSKPHGFMERLDEALADRLVNQISIRAFSDNPPPPPRTIGTLIDELADGLGEDPAELRRRLRGESGVKSQLLETNDSGLRLSLTKLLLETELEEKKAARAAAVDEKKAHVLGELVQTVKANLPDFLEAIKGQVSGWNQRGAAASKGLSRPEPATPQPDEEKSLGFICGECRKPFNVVAIQDHYICPYCGAKLDVPQTDGAPNGISGQATGSQG